MFVGLGNFKQALIIVTVAGAVTAILLSGTDTYAPTEPSKTAREKHTVVRVVDGDTIHTTKDGTPHSIRLIGIDAPEFFYTDSEITGTQCYAQEAKTYLRNIITNDIIFTEKDALTDDVDTYDRLLRYVYLEDGTFVNGELILNGYSKTLPFFPFSMKDDFIILEKEAQHRQHGLWHYCI